MFRNRRNSQKPSDELYSLFKQRFPHVGPGTVLSTSSVSLRGATSLAAALTDPIMDHRHFSDYEDTKDKDFASKDSSDHWRLTPSLMDPNSMVFASLVDQQAGCALPTPGSSMVYHNQAGDLHTPGFGFNLGTPLSMSTTDDQIPAPSALEMHGFNPALLESNDYHSHSHFTHQQSYAPRSFVHQDSGFETMDVRSEDTPDPVPSVKTEPYKEQDFLGVSPRRFESSMRAPALPSLEKFRYQVTLNAPTAMVRRADEIPVTYLNKGQAYVMSIADSSGFGPTTGPVKYRSVVRISFEDEQQRQRPAACWQLWKEGRGLAEAHQRSGRLQAVEYVDQSQGGSDEIKHPRVELESASFDSFSVTWTSAPGSNSADCTVAMRFNFLSTDFSHSKGVKGIPVRLCAKTEIISSGTPDSPPGPCAEVCYGMVKLFRDHGAERKLSNDIAHIKKTIDKLQQQVAQVQAGAKDVGKRKRKSDALVDINHRPSKVQRHKRTWSMSSQGSSGRPAVEDDLHMKLAAMQDMFTSTRPVSVLYLKGYHEDDPDVFPVYLPGEPTDLTKVESISRKTSYDLQASSASTPTSCIVSPSPTSHSGPSDVRSKERGPTSKSNRFDIIPQAPSEWEQIAHFSSSQIHPSSTIHLGSETSAHATKVLKSQSTETFPEWIDAFGVDSTYQAPPERALKPVACFYVLIKVPGTAPEDDFYRAVYLMERTVKDLIRSIAIKCEVDPDSVMRTFQINSQGLKVMVDNDVVRELPEGQAMVVEFANIVGDTKTLDHSSSDNVAKKVEMRLLF